ncbi:hypothetical protein [uncultured Sphingomonas sp.]|uniref:hypothetical protein n=1 Tax=uncultured Sphingomonas sp. TaxID=158754 RepID=UPI0025E9BCEB|nr:hypothetical protein [uncultured Sphingomonas sp.]
MNLEPDRDVSLPRELAAAFKDRAADEADVWRRLSPAQRTRALTRFEALRGWGGGRGELDVEAAAALAGDMSVSRFYRIAAEWRDTPSLASLGVFARAGARKSKVGSDVLDALVDAARQVILLHGDMSTSALVDRMVRFARLPEGAKLPGTTKLREILQAEQRRIASSMPLGQVILSDCVATSLPRADGRPHIGFLCMDAGTGAVLGVGVGSIEAVVWGHNAAANDALRTIGRKGGRWRWSNVFSVMRITAGEDVARISSVLHELNARFRDTHFILERGERRYGRMIARTLGPRLGKVTFTPTRTRAGEALAANGDMTAWTEADAYDALRRAADAHNDGIDLARAGSAEPPPNLYDALATLGGKHD